MSNSQNRARVRAQSTRPGDAGSAGRGDLRIPSSVLHFALATRPEAALVGWSSAAAATTGLVERDGPRTDHMAALVRRARRREAVRRMLRLWAPRRRPDLSPTARTSLSLGPSESSVRVAVQTGLNSALPVERRRQHATFDGPERRRSRVEHPAGRRLPEQRAVRAGVREL